MSTELGTIEAIFRYPVKSMRGEALEEVALGWHGLAGDRRFALRRLEHRGGFPFLSASSLPELVLFTPERAEPDGPPTHVITPEGESLPLLGEALAADVQRRSGIAVQVMQLRHGIFDEAPVSVITSDTVRELSRLAGTDADVRRFRANIVVRSARAIPFEEDAWVGGAIRFGDASDAPAIAITTKDVRCSMIGIDPDRGSTSPALLAAVTRANETCAGVYATVTRTGRMRVGQRLLLDRRSAGA